MANSPADSEEAMRTMIRGPTTGTTPIFCNGIDTDIGQGAVAPTIQIDISTSAAST